MEIESSCPSQRVQKDERGRPVLFSACLSLYSQASREHNAESLSLALDRVGGDQAAHRREFAMLRIGRRLAWAPFSPCRVRVHGGDNLFTVSQEKEKSDNSRMEASETVSSESSSRLPLRVRRVHLHGSGLSRCATLREVLETATRPHLPEPAHLGAALLAAPARVLIFELGHRLLPPRLPSQLMTTRVNV